MAKRRREARPGRERDEEKPRAAEAPEWQIDVPNDPANEQVVLAAMLVADPETTDRLLKRVPADAFYAADHRVIREAIAEARRKGLALDPATLTRLSPDADVRILERLPAARPDVPDNLDFHVETILWDRQRAQVARGPFSGLVEALQDPTAPPDRVRAIGRQLADALDAAPGKARFLRDPAAVVHEAVTHIRARARGEAFYPFGIPALDDLDEGGRRRARPGTAPGLVSILTGLSGSGKTTFAAHVILGVARQRRRVAVGAWEVRAPMTLELLAILSLEWSRSLILDGRSQLYPGQALTDEEIEILRERMEAISEYVVFIDNPFQRGSVRAKGRVSNDDHLDVLEDQIEASGAEVVVLDLFDRCLRWRAPDDEQEAVWRVVEFTDRHKIHTVLVHQQLMKGDNVRADKRPSLEGLKGSSAYVDAGAIILAPHLPARWKAVDDDRLELFGLKLRYANPFALEFGWDPDTGQIAGGRPFDAREQLEQPDDAFGVPGSRRGAGKGFHFNGKRRGRA